MGMSITNKKQRRLSMFLFALFFLVAVALTSFSFLRTVKVTQEAPAQELKDLKAKEAVMVNVALYSQALLRYEQAQKRKDPQVTKYSAECTKYSNESYQQLSVKDSTSFKNVLLILNMANQYQALIAEFEKNDSGDAKLQEEIKSLKEKIDQLKEDNGKLTDDKRNLESDLRNMQQIQSLKNPASTVIPTQISVNDEKPELVRKAKEIENEYNKLKQEASNLINDLLIKVNDIKSAPALANNNGNKNEIISALNNFKTIILNQN